MALGDLIQKKKGPQKESAVAQKTQVRTERRKSNSQQREAFARDERRRHGDDLRVRDRKRDEKAGSKRFEEFRRDERKKEDKKREGRRLEKPKPMVK